MIVGGFATFGESTNRVVLGIGDSLLLSWNAFLSWLPNILGAVIILIIGVYIAQLVRGLLKRILEALKFEKAMERLGVAKSLDAAGITISVSDAFLWLIYWIVALVFLNSAARVLGIPNVTEFIAMLVSFIPKIFAGLIIMLIGVVAARAVSEFLERITHATMYRAIARWVILIIAFVAAIEQLGFEIRFITTNLTIILAGIMLALGLAFGLGGKEKARDFLEKHLK